MNCLPHGLTKWKKINVIMHCIQAKTSRRLTHLGQALRPSKNTQKTLPKTYLGQDHISHRSRFRPKCNFRGNRAVTPGWGKYQPVSFKLIYEASYLKMRASDIFYKKSNIFGTKPDMKILKLGFCRVDLELSFCRKNLVNRC